MPPCHFVPTRDGTAGRRVDFGAITARFAEAEEPEPVSSPQSAFVRAGAWLIAQAIPVTDAIALVRAELTADPAPERSTARAIGA